MKNKNVVMKKICYVQKKQNVIFFKCDKKIEMKNSVCDRNSKTQIGTKLKDSNWYNTQKLKLGQNFKTQVVTKIKKKIKF